MDTMSAFMMGQANRGNPMRIFDWKKCAEYIRDNHPRKVKAGLSEDWEWTGGTVWEDGKIVTDDYTYLASTWATPVMIVDGNEEIECWVMESETKWDAETKWPKEARKIIGV